MVTNNLLFVEIVIPLIYGITWAVVCGKVADNKGFRDHSWRIWGFFFGVFAFLVLVTKPSVTVNEVEKETKPTYVNEKPPQIKVTKTVKMDVVNQQYVENCPLLIEKFVLVKEGQSEFVDLTFRNISDNEITAIDININAYDAFGELSEEIKNYHFSDVKFNTKSLFKSEESIPIKDVNAMYEKFVVVIMALLFCESSC